MAILSVVSEKWERKIWVAKRVAYSLVAALTFALALGQHAKADDQNWSKIVDAAKSEGKVVFYASLVPTTTEKLTAEFEKAYPGIKLEIFRNVDNSVAVRVQQELDTKSAGADLVSITAYKFYDGLIDGGNLVPIKGANIGQYSKAMYRDFAPFISSSPVGIAYNTELVTTAPTSYEDMLKGDYKGLIGMLTTDAGPAPTAFWDYLRTRWPGYWEKVRDQQPRFYTAAVPLIQGVASGEIGMGAWGFPLTVNPIVAKGGPIKLMVPSDEAFGFQWMVGVLKTAQHPNAAQVFADFMLSPQGQAILNGNGNGISALPGIPDTLPQTKLVTAESTTYTSEKLDSIIKDWKATFHN